MRTIVLAFILSSITAISQDGFNNVISDSCINGDSLFRPLAWRAYQTSNNRWDGERDSNCISLSAGLSDDVGRIQMDEIDITRPVFIEYVGNPLEIYPDQTYNLCVHSNTNSMIDLANNDFCDDGICEGLIMGIAVPDDPNDEDSEEELRYYYEEFQNGTNDFPYWGAQSIVPFCFASENFAGPQYMTQLILKFKFLPDAQGEYELDQVQILTWSWFASALDSASLLSFSSGPDTYDFYGSFDITQAYTLQHPPEVYSYPDSVYYLDVYPFPNTTEPTLITLTFHENTALLPYPYCMFRGGLVEGSNEIRHTYNLVMNGSIYCLATGEDLFDPGCSFIYNGGDLDLSQKSCLRFYQRSSLVVEDNQTFRYGKQGRGMLALHSGAYFILKSNAEFVLNSPISLWGNYGEERPENIHITLNSGNKFVFGPYSALRLADANSEMKIIFHLKGGILDYANLDEASRKNIEVICDKPDSKLAFLEMFGNPSEADFTFNLYSEFQDNAHFEFFSLNGELLFTESQMLQKGYNYIELNNFELPNAQYILAVNCGGERAVTRVEVYNH
jgi:hypothetical protein